MWAGPVISPASDSELLARQSALQAEAREVLAGLGLAALARGTARAHHRRPARRGAAHQGRVAPSAGIPGQVRGLDIYTAVIDDGVRTPGQFATWLARRAQPGTRAGGP